MAFVREIGGRFYQIESYRDPNTGKVRQRSLGRISEATAERLRSSRSEQHDPQTENDAVRFTVSGDPTPHVNLTAHGQPIIPKEARAFADKVAQGVAKAFRHPLSEDLQIRVTIHRPKRTRLDLRWVMWAVVAGLSGNAVYGLGQIAGIEFRQIVKATEELETEVVIQRIR